MAQEFTTADILRFELEQPPGELQNLVENPNGALGAWGWITPTTNSTLVAFDAEPLPYLKFTKTVSGIANFRTVGVAAEPGVNYRARVDIKAITAGHNIKIRLHFYDADDGLLALQDLTAATTSGTAYASAYTAPAGTATAELFVGLYKASGNPDANAFVEFNQAMIGEGGTAGAQSRLNEYANPSLEVNMDGFTADSGTTLTRTTADKVYGTYSLNVAVTTNGNGFEFTGDFFTTTKNTNYTFSFYVKSSIARNIRIDKRNSDGAGYHFTSTGPTVALAANVWTRYVWTFNTGNYYTDRFYFVTSSSNGAGGTYRIDGILMEEASSALEYFDGSIVPAGYATSSWNGAAHDSASTAQTAAEVFDYSDPQVYFDILGSSVEIGIQRDELDVGTLQASIRDSDLDPAVADTIRPGRKMRLLALVAGEWEPIFLGTISNAKVTYDLLAKQVTKRARIVLTATDYVTDLANTGRTEGVVDIDELPYVLEGVSVPWNVNGNTGHVSTASVAYTTDDASALDIIGVTRDTQRGFAWVSRAGVLNVHDAANMSNVAVPLDESVYNANLNVDYDTDRCINEINIKALRTIGDQTEEWAFGPYRDGVSIREWGSHKAEFTLAAPPGVVLNDAYFASFVDAVFASNAVPQVTVNSLTIPIRSLADLQYVLTDLYDLVEVSNAEANIVDQALRVTGISHSITPKHWLVTLSFAVDGGIASPAITPQLGKPSAGTEGTGYAFIIADTQPSIPNNAYTTVDPSTIRTSFSNSAYATYADGIITIQTAGTYVVSGAVAFPTNSTGVRNLRILQNNTTGAANTLFTGQPANSDSPTFLQSTSVWRLTAGDTVRLNVYQNSGASLSLHPETSNAGSNRLSVTWVGP